MKPESGFGLLARTSTGTGKTSLLNALSGAIPASQRTIVIEDTREVQLQGDHVVCLEARPAGPKGRRAITMRELFRALEQKKKILVLLDRFLEQPQGEIGIQVGLSEMHPTMGELSLIGISVDLPSGLSAKIAVLGPMRMNYERTISAVLHVGQAFQSVQA